MDKRSLVCLAAVSISVALNSIACVGPTNQPFPLEPASDISRTRLVVTETYRIVDVTGRGQLLPYGTYWAEAQDERGVYYRAPIGIKMIGAFGGAFGKKEWVADGGIYLPHSSFGRAVGPWLYIRDEDGSVQTLTIPGSFASDEGDLWYLETGPQQVGIGECMNGMRHGSYELKVVDGPVIAAGEYSQGKKNGVFVFHNTAGVLLAEIPYEDDQMNGTVRLWYSSQGAEGQPKLEAQYTANLANGRKQSWWPSGSDRSVEFFLDGALSEAEVWDESGDGLTKELAERLASESAKADEKYYRLLESEVDAYLPACAQPTGQ